MPLFRPSPPQNLAAWLALATRHLSPSTQIRLRAEIEAHYAEAVQTHLKNGLSESAAHASALKNLGDPHAAARAHRPFFAAVHFLFRLFLGFSIAAVGVLIIFHAYWIIPNSRAASIPVLFLGAGILWAAWRVLTNTHDQRKSI